MLKKVRIVGSGLIGTSIGLGLVQHGVSVQMVDKDPSAQALAGDLVGECEIGEPDLVIFALPTSFLPLVIGDEFALNPQSTFMDVGSVKAEVAVHVKAVEGLFPRFVPTHPMAGREIGGASSAQADLFEARTWIITAEATVNTSSIDLVKELITLLGATPIELLAEDHDRAVARISHLPQIAATLLAKQLIGTPPEWMELAGQGVRDTTRLASSDKNLWKGIIHSNKEEIACLLINLQSDLSQMIGALEEPELIAEIMEQGGVGKALIPGKHGGKAREYNYLPIVIDDKPGQLGAIFAECAAMNVNVEDLNIEHSPGQLSALITLSLSADDATTLSQHLTSIGWNVHPIRK